MRKPICFSFWLDELTIQPKNCHPCLKLFTDFDQIPLAVRAIQKQEPGRQEGRGFTKTDPPTFSPHLSRADTSLCACGSTKKKLNIGRPKLLSSSIPKQRHIETAPRTGELFPFQPSSRNRDTAWRTLFTPSFALETGYGLVSSFYTILARTESRESSSRTIGTCSSDNLVSRTKNSP